MKPDLFFFRTARQHRGFALVVTLSLMILLTVIALGLLTLSSISLRASSQSSDHATARSNARMALMLAIGELQKDAGPDQRVSAPADLAGGGAGARLSAGTPPSTKVGSTKYWDPTATSNGLSAVQPGTRYWTGIWGNADPSASIKNNGNHYEKTPRPRLLNWLVSGNESATFTASSTAFGQITAAGSNLTYTPAGAVSPALSPSLTATTATTAYTLSNATGGSQPAMLLVGPRSAGTSARTLPDGTVEPAIDRYVVAPLVTINPASTDPTARKGKFAWWIGDEGVKARYNLADPYTETGTATANGRLRLTSAQRVAGEFATAADKAQPTDAADTLNFTATPTYKYDDYPFPGNPSASRPASDLDKVLTFSGGRLVRPASTAESLLKRFHAVSADSFGVQANSQAGGLRQDLSLALTDSTIFNSLSAGSTSPTKILPASYSPTTGPHWTWIKDHFNLANRATDAIDLNNLAAPGQIAPFIASTRLLFKIYPNRVTNTWELRTSIAVWIANPYSQPLTSEVKGPLTSSAGLDLAFDRLGKNMAATDSYYDMLPNDASWGSWYVWAIQSPIPTLPATPVRIASFPVIWRNSSTTPSATPWTLNGSGTVFRIPPTTWAPGELKMFTLNNNTQTVPATTVTLAESTTSPLESRYFTYNTGVALPLTDTAGNPAANPPIPATSYVGFLQMHSSSSGSVLAGTPTGFAMSLYPAGGGPDSGTALTRMEVFNLLTSAPNTPTAVAADLDGGYTAWLLNLWTTLPATIYDAGRNYRYGYVLRPFADLNFGAAFLPPSSVVTSAAEVVPYPWTGYRHSNPPPTNLYTAGPTLDSGWSWGGSYSRSGMTWSRNVLYDLPARSGSVATPLLSLAQLQHVSLTADDEAAHTAIQPGQAVGNSFYCPLIARQVSLQAMTANKYSPNRIINHYDLSYLLNTRLFDGYFCSSYVGPSLGATLPNTRYQLIDSTKFLSTLADETPGTGPAQSLLVKGAFNINSTDPEAWASVLASTSGLAGPDGLSQGTPFPRFLNQTGSDGATQAHLGNTQDTYSGYRRLTDSQIRELARQMVYQVRQRGPFLSLAHFVNRVLESASTAASVSASELTAPLGLSGALQSAIDATTLNNFKALRDMGAPGNHWVGGNALVTTDGLNKPTYPDYLTDFPKLVTNNTATPRPPQGSTMTGAAGFLTQADVLQVLAPTLAARSDTFRIRTYGEVNGVDGVTPVARAWCEAIVQRIPKYLDSKDNPGTAPTSLSSTVNKTFGRKFQVISFRWLSPNDI